MSLKNKNDNDCLLKGFTSVLELSAKIELSDNFDSPLSNNWLLLDARAFSCDWENIANDFETAIRKYERSVEKDNVKK